MIKIRLFKFIPGLCFSLALFCCFNVNAQNIDAQKATALIQKNIGASGLTSADLQNSRISDIYYDKLSGATLVYLQQTLLGIDVDKKIKVIALKNEKIISALGSRYGTGLAQSQKAVSPAAKFSASDAVRAAAAHLNIILPSLAVPKFARQEASKETDFGSMGRIENIKAKLIWVTDQGAAHTKSLTKTISLCWAVDIVPIDSVNVWRVKVDAQTGKIAGKENYTVSEKMQENKTPFYTVVNFTGNYLNKNNFTGGAAINSASYRVVKFPAEAPTFPGGVPSIHTNPWELAGAGNDATTLKWNDDGTTIFDSTSGNNVHAELNWNNPETLAPLDSGAAYSSTPAPDLTFDYTPDFTKQPTTLPNRNFAVTNLFYWNNIMHDISYQYGFDEKAGNFQQNNLGRNGKGNDYVIAFAQDGKGQGTYLDNANFYTPANGDGFKPRMRMYLWSASDYPLTVNSPTSIKGNLPSVEGAVSTKNLLEDVGPVTGNVVLYTDINASTSLACVEPSNMAQLKGKIALIDRGSCNFTDKIEAAQNAGAIAVIVANNDLSGALLTMSGDDDLITIPAVSVSYQSGQGMKKLLANGTTINVTLKATIKLDGDADAGIMCHEYTHGISNRLTGGPSTASCLQNSDQMGEGWSDYDALMFTTDWTKATKTDGSKPHPIGTYADAELPSGTGIRRYPYSTDMSIDKWTYSMMPSTGGEVHYIGEIWCSILWDMTWNIIQTDGINSNIYNADAAGGNSIALKLVYEGMKLQACSPGFIDGRDAILKADTLLYDGKYSCAIWNAFSRRGVGIFASEGSSEVFGDEYAYFGDGGLLITKHVNKDSAAQGEELTYNIGVKALITCGTTVETGSVVDTLPKNITYVTGSGGVYNATNRTVTFSGISIKGNDSSTYTFKATVNNNTYFKPKVLFYDEPTPKKDISAIWDHSSSNWDTINFGTKAQPNYWYLSYEGNTAGDNKLTTVNTYVIPGYQTTLGFYNQIFTYYAGYNGGVVEISTDNGTTWQDLGNHMSGFVYNLPIIKVSGNLSPIAGRKAFTGSNSFGYTSIDLSSFAGKHVKIRFRFVTINGYNPDNTYLWGWIIAGISLVAEPAVDNFAQSFGADGAVNSTSDAYTVIKDAVLPVTWENFTASKQKNTALLQWTTAQEINSASFDIERSNNGINFTKLGSQQAAGNSTIKQNYEFVDETPLQGTNIYRIKQIDKDGKFNYSVYRQLIFDDVKSIFSLTPNPAKEKVKVTITGNTKLLHIILTSGTGQQLKSYEMNGETLNINLPSLASGVYNVIVSGDGVSYKQKLVIE